MMSRAQRLIRWSFCAISLLNISLPLQAESVTQPVSAAQYDSETALVTPQLAKQFLGRPYVADTLGGGPGKTERLTLRTDVFDCFTLLDTLEAMRRQTLQPGTTLPQQLQRVRYHGPGAQSEVSWLTRNHFFSDWLYYSPQWVTDVTPELGLEPADSRQVRKQLNQKSDGTLWLEGIPQRSVVMNVLAAEALDYSRLQAGDYIGIYTELAGLDVTHVGLAVKDQGQWYLRHASSRYGKVIDEPLAAYLSGKPGVIIYRPIQP